MPSKTAKQARFMAAVAHGWEPRSGKAPPIAVAKKFVKEDQKKKRRRTIAEGD